MDSNNDNGSGKKSLEDHDDELLPSAITVRIREREKVVPVQISPAVDNVYSLKQRLTSSTSTTNSTSNPYIRLIAAGRLLAPDSALLNEFALSDNQVIHAVILDRPPPTLLPSRQTQQVANNDDDYDEEEEGVYYQEEEVDDEDNNDDDRRSPLLLPAEEDDSGIVDVDLDQMEMGTLPRPITRTRTTSRGGRRVVGRPPAPQTSTPPRQRRNRPQQSQRQRLPLGFDRLRMTASLRRTEITVLRMYFNSHIDAFLRDRPELMTHLQQLEPNDTLRRRRYAEQAWMEAQSPTSDFAMNVMDQQHYNNGIVASTMTAGGGGGGVPSGLVGLRSPLTTRSTVTHRGSSIDNREFIWGFLLGYFVGYYMLIWVWIPSIPYRQKMGILAGYCLSLTMGLLHGSNQSGINQQQHRQDFDHHEYLDDSLLPPMME
jgi:hypothetical protein